MAKIIAYTLGSFWFCAECAGKVEQETEPVPENLTFGCYWYHCDGCGTLLKEMTDPPLTETPAL